MAEKVYDPYHERPAPDPVVEAAPPFLAPIDLERLHSIASSETWQVLAKGMRELRESLLNSHPTTDAALNQTWGRIMQLSDLLQGGPMLVLNAAKLAEQRNGAEAMDVAVHTYTGE
jgi:hypothetical protein